MALVTAFISSRTGGVTISPFQNKKKLTFGQSAADALTRWVGSWTFIIGLCIFMLVWMTINVTALIYMYDPYPFILLNFVLSTLAAIQAPIILMSQNRENERDRIRMKYDYDINRKAEREVQQIQQELAQLKDLQLKTLKKIS